MIDKIKDFIGNVYKIITTMLFLVIPFVLALGLLLCLYDFMLIYTCNQYTKFTGIETKISHFNTCFIKDGDVYESYEVHKAKQAVSKIFED